MPFLDSLTSEEEESSMGILKRQPIQGNVAPSQIAPVSPVMPQMGQPIQPQANPMEMPQNPPQELRQPELYNPQKAQVDAKRMALMNMQKKYNSQLYNKMNPVKI